MRSGGPLELSLGRRADYAIRATVDLARHYEAGRRRKATEIAEEMSIPTSYVPQILAALVRAQIASSHAGPNGGYLLVQAPLDISLLDVVRATEGEPSAPECVLRGGPCHWDDICAVHIPWSRARRALLDRLAQTSFAEIAKIDEKLESGTFELPHDLRDEARADSLRRRRLARAGEPIR